MSPSALPAYGIEQELSHIELIGSGLINHTWKVICADKAYILQRVNNTVFEEPEHIAHNIKLVAGFLKTYHPEYLFVAPVISNAGDEMIYLKDEGFFRLFPFVPNSHTIDVVESPKQAFEAASQFGRFTRLLNGIDISRLKITIPFFHDLSLRYQQFLHALKEGNKQRIKLSDKQIKTILSHEDIVAEYERIKANPAFKVRVTHHDTKISNVLFDDDNKGLCVIDLDTIMPGYFISDVGDMMRTFLSPVSEEENDFSKIEIRDDFYHAIVQGYNNEMKNELTETEKKYFFYSAKFMIYMQAIRFLADHLNDDRYYGARYQGHNFVRAGNQLTLLERLLEKETRLQDSDQLVSNKLY